MAEIPRNASLSPLERFFDLKGQGSSVATEVRAGVTTFLTMAYILFVNPQILGQAIKIEGVELFPELLTATALAAALGTLAMGLIAKYPFALAPGMGINAYFTYSVVMGQGIDWRVGLGAVFLSGLAFLLLSVTGVRELVINAIPPPLKIATSAGIGLFLAIIGAETSGLVVDHPATLLTLGNMGSASVLLALLGLLVTTVLLARRVPGAILIGISAVTFLAILTSAKVYPGQASFGGLGGSPFRAPVWPSHLFLALDIEGALGLGLLGILFVFLFVDLFDTAGTLIGLSQKANFTDEKGQLPRASRAFASDAIATSVGALLGTTTTTSYIESASGIEEGGRTGLTAVVVAFLFAASLFLWPLAGAVPACATAPALIVIGALMIGGLRTIEWSDPRIAVPAFLTIVAMPLTYSIANGIAFGIVSYALIHALSGRAREVHWLMYLLAALLMFRYVYLGAA